jgi:hypothetical protein
VWEDVIFSANTYTCMGLEQLDMVAFYQVFNMAWLNIDLGIDIKYINFKFQAEGIGSVWETGAISGDLLVLMVLDPADLNGLRVEVPCFILHGERIWQ